MANALRLSLYVDQYAPAIGDWTRIHKPSLERSRALILICTPGIFSKLSSEDWVHTELNWWVEHRKTAPIIVDTTGEGERWMPDVVRYKWPNAQRILLRKDDLKQDASVTERIIKQLVEGIRFSETAVLFQDVEEQRKLLRRFKLMLVSTALVTGIAVFGLMLALELNRQITRSNERLDKAVEQTERAAELATRIAEADALILEVLYGKAITEGKGTDARAQEAWNAVQDARKKLRPIPSKDR